ncbi:Clavaminate synthase-like protein [Dentipellis sp. KUC8613]|nr:Clavaminate synthase-like protein [Dentipellis sp. KUC8613]
MSTAVDDVSIQGPDALPKWIPPPTTTQTNLDWADILTVDLSLYDTARNELVETVSRALQRDGFFYVVGHGLDPEKLHRQFSISQLTFEGVSREEKEAHRAPIAEEGSFIGYKLQNYWEITNGIRDRIEHYNFYLQQLDPITRHPKPIQPYVEEIKAFIADIRQDVLRRVLSLIDAVLGLEEGYLWRLHQDPEGRPSNDFFRYMTYDPLPTDEAAKTNNVMLNGHTDFGSVTILASQPVTALQILLPDGKWRYVQHRDNALVINIGDQLSFMSGGILKGTIHRVVQPPEDQRKYRRIGVFHFAQLFDGISLEPLPSKKVQEQGRRIPEERVPTSDEWHAARVKSYGNAKLVRGEKYDVEYIAGLQVRHWH